MSNAHYPSVDVIHPQQSLAESSSGNRWKIFSLAFLVTAGIGLTIVFLQPAIYEAAVSIVVSKPKDIDRVSDVADVENIAIQTHQLIGQDTFSKLHKRLKEQGFEHSDLEISNSLNAVPLPQTNIIELRATGDNPEFLRAAVNGWAQIYSTDRQRQIAEVMDTTIAKISEEQRKLNREIEQSRQELALFRERHNIVSLDRDDNKSSSALRGLNRSLSQAREGMLTAQSEMLSIERAISQGEIIVPRDQRSSVTQMQVEAASLRKKLEAAQENFTQKYIDRDPFLAGVPDTLRDLEHNIETAISLGQTAALTDAKQKYESQKQALELIESELGSRKENIATFTESFKDFKAMEETLERKQALFTDSEARLTQIRMSTVKEYPPIQILALAPLPIAPISPDYKRNSLIALVFALFSAIFVTWLVGYLTNRSGATYGNAPSIGIRIYNGDAESAQSKSTVIQTGLPAAESTSNLKLAQSNTIQLPRELAKVEISKLLEALSPTERGLCWLLLSGVSPQELALIRKQDVEPSLSKVTVNGPRTREIIVAEDKANLIAEAVHASEQTGEPLSSSRLDFALLTAARDSNMEDPISVDSLAIWHTYVMYLVRQGIDLGSLEKRVGPMPAIVASTLGLDDRPTTSQDYDYLYGV